jgi:hypothetical protein
VTKTETPTNDSEKSKNTSALTLRFGHIQFPDDEVQDFQEQGVERPFALTAEGWRCGLRETEIDDNKQKLKARPFLAWGVGVLLVLQTIGIWFIVVWALNKSQLGHLQLIFSTLVAGTLTQSYFLLRLITEKVFGDINYHNSDESNS